MIVSLILACVSVKKIKNTCLKPKSSSLNVVIYSRLRSTPTKEEKVENDGNQLPVKTQQARTPPPDYNETV